MASLKDVLKWEFLRRRKRNPQYSMRAFAKFLGTDQSYLSQVLRGQQIPSESKLEKIAYALKIDDKSTEKIRQSLKRLRLRKRQKRIGVKLTR